MSDPYQVLNLSPAADDDAIRRRYLELTRQYSPEHFPEKFAAIRAAYESLRDLDTRLRKQLLKAEPGESLENLIEEVACRSSRRRLSLDALRSILAKP
ncbi:MAG TPA: J domain-containing protein [Gemmataceae bacterium]|jgi:curved DNA-binding protein CbpA|nr:J domain-containing protein [Gemmataceae bacterium]